MSNRHLKTLAAVFERPVRANIAWRDIEAMFRAAGATIAEGDGSRVKIELLGITRSFHRPHPQKETDRGAVRSVSAFLTRAGLMP